MTADKGISIIVTGATGLVGAALVQEAILDPAISKITVLTRRPLAFSHPKIVSVIHSDYEHYEAVMDIFLECDAVVWCLGVSTSQVSKEEYIRITYDYAIACATTMKKVNPMMTFLFVSGSGADQEEKSKLPFARIKGRTEKKLAELGLHSLIIVRPAAIRPVIRNPNTALMNKLMSPFFPALEWVFPNKVIKSTDLAVAMIRLLKEDSPVISLARIVENKELRVLGMKNLGI